MSVFRFLSAAFLLLLLGCGQAMAYQYAGYAPYRYVAPQQIYQPYAAPYPYYPAYRHPVRPAPWPIHRPVQARQNQAQPAVTKSVETNTIDKVPAKKNTHRIISGEKDKPREIITTSNNKNVLTGEKQDFIETLLPFIEKENQRLSQLRNDVIKLLSRIDDNKLDQLELKRLQKITKKYRIDGDLLTSVSARDELLSKIDIIPASLALAQAANESAWGKSRFALEANNLFGLWTYDETRGLKPKNREAGKTHLVRIFDDIGESVQYYMHTLNSHPAYSELRQIREQLRMSAQMIDGHKLAAGLKKYSAKGQKYIDLIQLLIRQNKWASLSADKRHA